MWIIDQSGASAVNVESLTILSVDEDSVLARDREGKSKCLARYGNSDEAVMAFELVMSAIDYGTVVYKMPDVTLGA